MVLLVHVIVEVPLVAERVVARPALELRVVLCVFHSVGIMGRGLAAGVLAVVMSVTPGMERLLIRRPQSVAMEPAVTRIAASLDMLPALVPVVGAIIVLDGRLPVAVATLLRVGSARQTQRQDGRTQGQGNGFEPTRSVSVRHRDSSS
jgi:hypothetical protein